jgi:plastocyanin domain-containing protein
MNKTVSIIITLGLVIAIGIIFSGGSGPASVNNVEIKDGVQYIRIEARGGYSPKVTSAKAGIPTKLIMKTNGVFDCSAALVIPAIGFQKMLPQTGDTEIDLGTPVAGSAPIRGVCGMGMYSFTVNFN